MNRDDRRPPLYHYWTPNYWPIWLALGLLRLVCLLPHKARLSIGFALGRLGHRLISSRRAITRRNIELCFPDLSAAERDAMALAHFESLGASFIEMGIGRWASDKELLSLVEIEGVEHLQTHVEDNKGIILLSAHFTTMDMSGRVLSMHCPPFDAVYRKSENAVFTEILRSSRERSARRAIEKRDIKSMVRSLRERTPVWYAPDQSYQGKQSAVLPFFGIDCMANTATTTLARLGRAVAVPFFPRRLENGHYLLSLQPALQNFPSDDAAVDTMQYHAVLERQIRRAPEQYYWIHKKFKNRPSPLPNVYDDLDSLK